MIKASTNATTAAANAAAAQIAREERTANRDSWVARSATPTSGTRRNALPQARCRSRNPMRERCASRLASSSSTAVSKARRARSTRPPASALRPSWTAVREKSESRWTPTARPVLSMSARAAAAERVSSSRWAFKNSNHRARYRPRVTGGGSGETGSCADVCAGTVSGSAKRKSRIGDRKSEIRHRIGLRASGHLFMFASRFPISGYRFPAFASLGGSTRHLHEGEAQLVKRAGEKVRLFEREITASLLFENR